MFSAGRILNHTEVLNFHNFRLSSKTYYKMEYVVIFMDQVTNKIFFVNGDGMKSTRAPAGVKVRVPTYMAKLLTPGYHEKASTVEVVALPVTYTIPMPLINSLPSGPVESFASTIGFHYQPSMPKDPTVAMLLNLQAGKFKSFQLVLGGPAKVATVPFSKLLGLEKRTAGSPDAAFTVTINPQDIQFPVSRSVTTFTPINELFKGSITHPGVDLNWGEGAGVYTRYGMSSTTLSGLSLLFPFALHILTINPFTGCASK